MRTIAVSPVSSPAPSSVTPLAAGWRRFALLRILAGTALIVLPVGLTMFAAHQLVDKSMRGLWPQLLAAALCVLGYRCYVRSVEGRAMTEFGRAGAGRELGTGLALGAAMFLLAIGILAAAGAYRVSGSNGWSALLVPSTELVLVALFEETLFRGVLQRNLERALGTWPSVAFSAILFGLAHLPNANATAAAIGVTVVAGLLFAAAYLATRRLWLAVGMHFAWNFMSDAIFSVTTSGHPGKGILAGSTAGPDWLSGGAYGIEASVVTLAVLTLFALGLFAAARRRGMLAAGVA
ncbi:CPBP family intramembrane glutamic endopeptidase [uncultured Massilia sp.]|uniref:CPBP family intramembrane glutamic endopeptidase n=1 Tax=uncultured Massilia sp. TaxID=169973 RepID=UPI0025CEF7C8|nr:CPBP family intramembrane glutamic endopeptidase [uncultured Massilia sp.]